MIRGRRAALLTAGTAVAATALIAAPRAARACATCACGDPTLTTMGEEKPLAGRLRASIDLRYRTDALGAPRMDRVELREERVDLALSWAPLERLFLAVVAPVAYRELTYVNLARERVLGLGDAELRAKYFLFLDRRFAPQHLIAVQVGLELPIAGTQRDADGVVLPDEAQLGTGGFDPIVGASYALFRGDLSGYASATLVQPTAARAGLRPGRSVTATVAGQLQADPRWAGRLGVDARFDQVGHLDGGGDEPDTGGAIAFASPQLVYSPVTDLLVTATVRVPFWNRLRGDHDEGVIAQTAVTYDF